MREIAQDVLQEADGAQRACDGDLVAHGLEAFERAGIEIERRAVIEQQLAAPSLLEQRLGQPAAIGQFRGQRGGFHRVVQRAMRVGGGDAVDGGEQQREALRGIARGVEPAQDVVDVRRVGHGVTHARPRPGSRRTSRRGPCR